jgi:hypothetical protein
MPLLWGDFKVVQSAFRRMRLIKDVLFIALGSSVISGSSSVMRRERYFWGVKDMPLFNTMDHGGAA